MADLEYYTQDVNNLTYEDLTRNSLSIVRQAIMKELGLKAFKNTDIFKKPSSTFNESNCSTEAN